MQNKQSRCIPELALEVVEDRGTPEFAGASGACSEGLPLLVKEIMAHLNDKKWFQIKYKIHGVRL
jgi:hypothetical protein